MTTRSKLSELAFTLSGLPVYGCLPGSPAAQAGVRYGDVLLGVDDHATPSWDAYLKIRESSGASIRLRLFRDGHELEVVVPLHREHYPDGGELATTLGMLQNGGRRPPDGGEPD